MRLIESREFAAKGSLRFPRVVKIRWADFNWREALDGALPRSCLPPFQGPPFSKK